MLSALYNALWYPALPFALIAAGGADQRNRRERLGRGAMPALTGGPRIWIHAASVGEIEAVRPVAAGLHTELPSAAIVVTTMTPAGREAAHTRIAGAAAAMLAPLDCAACVRAFLGALRPQAVLIAETELWPNYLVEARRAGARLAIINGRISGRSIARYLRARSLFARALGCADLVLAQTRDDASRYLALGAPADRIHVTGNTKFDLDGARATASLRPELESFAAGRPIFVAGSTAAGEDPVLVAAYLELRTRFPGLALVIAPRHLDRVAEIENALRAGALAYVKASALGPNGASGAADVMVLDTMGELRAFYRRAAVAFVGGSLVPGRGGQNPAEPALASVPVLIGPFHENQRELTAALLERGGAQIVRDARQLAEACAPLLADDAVRRAAGDRARQAAESFCGGARATLAYLRAMIDFA